MKKIIYILSLTLLIGCTSKKENINLKKEIGQMILVGFNGKTLPKYLKNDIKDGRIGGIILFDYDAQKKVFDKNIKSPEQVKSLITEAQSHAKTPLFVAIDQEGGIINRLHPKYGFPETISAQKLGEINELNKTYENAEIIASTLKELGFNLNFAPVVDLNTNPNNPAIGKKERSYSPKASIVAKHAEQVINAHDKQNILTALKHFPGHGSSWNDSHEGFVDLSETWIPEEIEPYKTLIKKNKAHMIMTAHVFNKNLDKENIATLSPKILTQMLRNEMKFEGIIISDDLQMDAIRKHFTLEETVVKLINAGANILLVGNNLGNDPEIDEKIQKIIIDKIESGEIDIQRIHDSYNHIMKLKKEFKIIQ